MRFAGIIAFIGLLVSPCQAQEARIDGVHIIDYGLYAAQIGGRSVQSGVVLDTVWSIQHTGTTTTIPARVGVDFGFQFRLVGRPAGMLVPLTAVTIYPPQGLVDPSRGRVYREQFDLPARIGDTSGRGRRFDRTWELVPGVWTLEIWDRDRRLASMRFNVVRQQRPKQ